jgi:hypothetical protein
LIISEPFGSQIIVFFRGEFLSFCAFVVDYFADDHKQSVLMMRKKASP